MAHSNRLAELSKTVRHVLLPLALPRITEIRHSEWDEVLTHIRETPFDSIEKAGLLLGLAFATYLLGADNSLAADATLPVIYAFNFLLAVPLLGALAGPFYLRCWRRGLDQEIEQRERQRPAA